MKFFMIVVFFKVSPEQHFFGPFESEQACYSWDYLQKDGGYYFGHCKLLDPATVPVTNT